MNETKTLCASLYIEELCEADSPWRCLTLSVITRKDQFREKHYTLQRTGLFQHFKALAMSMFTKTKKHATNGLS